jgi:hypothetical protein
MKRGIWMLLAFGSVVLAGEADQPAPRGSPAPDSDPDPAQLQIQPDGTIKLPDGRILSSRILRVPAPTCYYIRTMGLLPDGSAPRTGFIPLQSRSRPMQLAHGPDCTNGARLTPVPMPAVQWPAPDPPRQAKP